MRQLTPRIRCRRSGLLVMLTALLVVAPAALASAPPSPGLRGAPAPFIGFVVMFVLLGLILVPSLMPSKRSHQD